MPFFTDGADIVTSQSSCLIKMASTDTPHGTFSLSQPIYHVQEVNGDDSVTSLSDFASYVTVTILRRKGTIGKVSCSACRKIMTFRDNSDERCANLCFATAMQFSFITFVSAELLKIPAFNFKVI